MDDLSAVQGGGEGPLDGLLRVLFQQLLDEPIPAHFLDLIDGLSGAGPM